MKVNPSAVGAVVCTFAFSASILAQGPSPEPACSPITLQSVPHLTFRQRTCLYGEELISPKFALAAGFAAAFGQWENAPYVRKQHFDEFGHRLEVYYARRSARDAGEMIAGYLHHEDPRYHRSEAKTFWRRTHDALMSVVDSPDENGRFRLSYAPVAGSFASALTGSVMYKHTEAVDNTLAHVGLVYAHYFIHALFTEFKPDINALARHLLLSDPSK